MRRQTGQDGTGFFFLSLSPIQRMEKGGRNWLPMPWNRAGDIGRFTMLTDMHVKRLHFSFSKARQNRTEHTHNGHDGGLRCRFREESQTRMETMNWSRN